MLTSRDSPLRHEENGGDVTGTETTQNKCFLPTFEGTQESLNIMFWKDLTLTLYVTLILYPEFSIILTLKSISLTLSACGYCCSQSNLPQNSQRTVVMNISVNDITKYSRLIG